VVFHLAKGRGGWLQNDNINTDTVARIGQENVYNSPSNALGIHLYWYALLSDTDKVYYEDFPGVGLAHRVCRRQLAVADKYR